MKKTYDPSSTTHRLCPTCGTRVGVAATRCLVCGADLSLGGGRLGGRWRLNEPITIVVLVIVVIIVALALGVLFVVASRGGGLASILRLNTATPSGTPTLPPTITPSPTATETPEPTATPLPPIEYTVVANDTCISIALRYNVSVPSIIALNNLDPKCNLRVGAKLLVPQPTTTPTMLPTATLPFPDVTEAPRLTYTVQLNDTLSGIAAFYGVPVEALMETNGLARPEDLRAGQILVIPVEKVVPAGPTSTPTLPPPYPAPALLLPADGHPFSGDDREVLLQWVSVGTLRPGEYYYVTVEDVTCNCARFYRQATLETRLIVPLDFRPTDAVVHVFRWQVGVVRQKSTGGAAPVYEPAGVTSSPRTFTWMGSAAVP